MRLAVIIPCYNHAHYIGAALESVLGQTRKPDRIIVIDDGSRDDSVAVIQRFADRGVELTARENRGAHNTINELVERASADCDVISILNSDDHYAPERFARCLPLLEANPDKHVICTGIRVIDGEDLDIAPDEPRAKWFRAVWSLAADPEPDLCAWLGVANFPATTSNVIARAAWLRQFPFRPYRFNHDYYFLAQTVLRDAMAVVPEPLVNYRVHGTNTMNTDPAPLLREMLRMNLDLAHDIAPELLTDAGLRTRYARYSRALWDSISSLHAGLLQTVLANSLSRLSSEEIEVAVAALDTGRFPELQTYPNKALVNTWDGTSPLLAAQSLAETYQALRDTHRETKSRERGYKELAALRARLSDSKWLALGRALGCWKAPAVAKAEPAAQAAALRDALQQQAWVKLGARFRQKIS